MGGLAEIEHKTLDLSSQSDAFDHLAIEMGPDPNRAYFLSAINKGLTKI